MKRILVAGATGYLGRFMVRELKRSGYWVRALVRNPGALSQAGPHGAPAIDAFTDDIFQGEITKLETIRGMSTCDYTSKMD